MRGVLGVRRGFQEVAGFLGVNGVAEGIFIVGGHRGDHGGIGGAEMVAVVMTKGCGVKVCKIAPKGSCGFRGVLCSGVSMVSFGMKGSEFRGFRGGSMSKRQRLDSQPKRKAILLLRLAQVGTNVDSEACLGFL